MNTVVLYVEQNLQNFLYKRLKKKLCFVNSIFTKYISIIYLETLKLIQHFNHGCSSKWNEKNNSTDIVFLKLSRCAFLYTLTIEQTNVDVYQSQVPQREQIQLQNLTLKSPTYMSILISFCHILQELSDYSLTIHRQRSFI